MKEGYSFYNPVKVFIGRGSLSYLERLLKDIKHVALVTTRGMLRRGYIRLLEEASSCEITVLLTDIPPNPSINVVIDNTGKLREGQVDAIIALGGGSVIDAAKALALFCAVNSSDEELKNIIKGNAEVPLLEPLSIIAVPTTAGTGSEVTPWASIWDDQSGDKYSLSHECLFPEVAILDARLLDSMPYELSLISALDALSHSMEAIWNKHHNPVSDVLASRAIECICGLFSDAFRHSYKEPGKREQMQYAAYLSGLAFSNTKTALAHSLSYPFTGQYQWPHGIACSFTLPEILKLTGDRYPERIAMILEAFDVETLNESVDYLSGLYETLGVYELLGRYAIKLPSQAVKTMSLITPNRAENSLVDMSQAEAVQLIESIFSRYI